MSRRYMPGILFLLLAAAGAARAYAAAGSAAETFFSIVPDPVAAAMGGAFMSQSGDNPSAAAANPASLNGISRPTLAFDYLTLPSGTRYNFTGLAIPGNTGIIGISGIFLPYGTMDGYDKSGNPLNLAESYDTALMLSYALPVKRSIPVYREYGAVGVNFKLLHSKLADYSAEAVAVDIGALYNIPFISGLRAGAAYRNIGSSVKYISVNNPLPRAVAAGIGYANASLMDMQATVDYVSPEHSPGSVSAGISLSPIYFVDLRCGWKSAADTLVSGLSAGFGIELGSFVLDYSFTPQYHFSPLHHIGISAAVGNILSAKTASDYYLGRHFQAANANYQKKDFIEARSQCEDILSIYPDHQPTQKLLSKIMDAMEKADRLKEKRLEQWVAKAEAALDRKDVVTANRYFGDVLEFDPENPAARSGLAKTAQMTEEVRKDRLWEKNAGKIQEFWKNGVALYRKGDYVKAREAFNGILAIDPEHEEAKKYVVETDNQLSKIAANEINRLFFQGTDLYKAGRYPEAIRYFEAVVIAAPHRLDAQEFITQSRLRMEEIDASTKAERVAKDQSRMKNDMAGVYEQALDSYERGKYEAALSYFQKSEALAAKYEFKEYLDNSRNYISTIKSALSEQHYRAGFEMVRKNRFEAAAAEYRKAIQLNPDNQSARVELDNLNKNLAQQYFEQGMAFFTRSEMDKARELFKRSLSYQPDKQESLRALERIR